MGWDVSVSNTCQTRRQADPMCQRLVPQAAARWTRSHWQSLQVPHRAAAAEAHRRWCTVRDMMHEVRAEPLDHRTRSAGIETGEVCQRTSHSPWPRVCSTWYGSGTAAPSGSHLPQGRHPPKRFLVVEAPCSGPSDAGRRRGGMPWGR